MPPKKFIQNKNVKPPTFKKTSSFLVIVESPSKCAKIESFLGSNFQCIASKGHLRTIDSLKSIHPKDNYNIDFSIIKEKQSHIDFMRSVIIQFLPENIFIASDADREGEAIGWHICDLFQLPVETTQRILFREITKPAILNAIQNPTRINMNLVRSQKARQILDLFVGFKISPYLWKYIFSNKANSLSAGRCQTPCLRLVYDNEKERSTEKLETSYKTTATFFSKNTPFVLNHEFSKEEDLNIFLEKSKKHPYKMTICSPKDSINKPPKPFNTSRLLQVASNQLNISPKQTMSYCQILYQEGLITYMRTDSNQYSKDFLKKATNFIQEKWGDTFIGSHDNLIHNDNINPHEAIRVTHLETISIPSEKDPRLNTLYKLIWKNTIESCMSDSKSKITPIQITSPLEFLYIHSIEIPLFLGWKIVSFDKKNTTTDEQTLSTTNSTESFTFLQNNGSGVLLYLESLLKTKTEFTYNKIQSNIVVHSKHKHYTEASLIQKLEEFGIGRPSTFSMLIETIQERGYVKKTDLEGEHIQCNEFVLIDNKIEKSIIEKIFGNEKNKLVIQPVGVLTIEFLIQYFDSLFSYDYTKKMEDELDHNINPFSICDECQNEIREQSQKINQIEKKIYKINDDYEVVFQRYGPVLRKIGCKKEDIIYKTIRKDIQLDLEKLKNNQYKIDDLLEIPNEILGEYDETTTPLQGSVVLQTLSSHSSTPEFQRNVTPNGSTFLQNLVYLKTGIYGPYIEWKDKKINIKEIEKPINEIKLEDVLYLIVPNDCDNIRKPPTIGKNMLRRITDDLSIRKGKFGAYIYYKTQIMGSPEFYQLKGFKQGFQTCELEELKTWIKEKYNIPK